MSQNFKFHFKVQSSEDYMIKSIQSLVELYVYYFT